MYSSFRAVMYSRRDFGRAALAGLSLTTARAATSSVFGGVRIGNMTYSFRDLSLDGAIKAHARLAIDYCELDHGHVERPLGFRRDEEGRKKLRQWRLSAAALDEYKSIRGRFRDAGVHLWGLI